MQTPKRYSVNEMFYSLQGEGVRAGTVNVFVRFAGCNLRCVKETHGFDCDTDFEHGEKMTARQIVDCANMLWSSSAGRQSQDRAVIFTGGEPALQLDRELVAAFAGWFKAVETNGTRPLPEGLDWVTCSPKPPDDDLAIASCDEVKYVIGRGAKVPSCPPIVAKHWILSPATTLVSGTRNDTEAVWVVERETLAEALEHVQSRPRWRLSVQQHKWWGVR